jgi:hypothetical protein
MLAIFEADTGLPIDRSASKRSFLGLPIYVAVGDTVYVTDDMGRRVKGTITQLSRSSLQLAPLTNEPSAGPRDFDQPSIRKVELTNMRWGSDNNHFTGIGVTGGFILGVLWFLYLAEVSDVNPFVALLGVPTAGGFLGYSADRQRTQDVYQAP